MSEWQPIGKDIYPGVTPLVRSVARQCGYAIGEHGSRARDLDLIAVPWTAHAADAATLVGMIIEAVGGHLNPRADGGEWPREKPHGRRCWSIFIDDPADINDHRYIDLSVTSKTTYLPEPPSTPSANQEREGA